MPYTDKQVERGRKLVASLDKSKWALGELAQEVAPEVKGIDLEWATSPLRSELENFADAIGLDYKRFLTYRRVALAFPVAKRNPDASFTIHQELASHDDRFKLIKRKWTVRTLRDHLGRASKDGAVTSAPLTAKQKVAIAREVLTSPTIAKELFREKDVRVAATKATDKAVLEDYQAIQDKHELDNPQDAKKAKDAEAKGRAVRLGLEFRSSILHAKRDLLGALERWAEVGGPLPKEQAEEIVEELNAVINAATAVIEVVNGGTTLDQGLAALLAGGE